MNNRMKTLEKIIAFAAIVVCVAGCSAKTSKHNKELVLRDTTFIRDTVVIYDRGEYDSSGLKTGLWSESKDRSVVTEVYYKKGKKDGTSKTIDVKTGRLVSFGEYKEGVKSGTWYYFDAKTMALLYKETNVTTNSEKVVRKDGKETAPLLRAYVIFYYPDGSKKCEGTALFDETAGLGSYKIGKWAQYEPNNQ